MRDLLLTVFLWVEANTFGESVDNETLEDDVGAFFKEGRGRPSPLEGMPDDRGIRVAFFSRRVFQRFDHIRAFGVGDSRHRASLRSVMG